MFFGMFYIYIYWCLLILDEQWPKLQMFHACLYCFCMISDHSYSWFGKPSCWKKRNRFWWLDPKAQLVLSRPALRMQQHLAMPGQSTRFVSAPCFSKCQILELGMSSLWLNLNVFDTQQYSMIQAHLFLWWTSPSLKKWYGILDTAV